jgi:hypothetical protein
MKRITLAGVLLLAVVACSLTTHVAGVTWYTSLSCKLTYPQPIEWDEPEMLCDEKGRTWRNTWGQYGISFANCVMDISQTTVPNVTVVEDVIFETVGTCGCPLNCSSSFRGTCQDDRACVCASGYTGADCTRVSCAGGQTCFGRGTCRSLEGGWDVCECDAGYGGIDCAAEMGSPPPVKPTLDVPQYTSWDRYGEDNPIFDRTSVAVINVEVDPAAIRFFMTPSNFDTDQYAVANMVGPRRRVWVCKYGCVDGSVCSSAVHWFVFFLLFALLSFLLSCLLFLLCSPFSVSSSFLYVSVFLCLNPILSSSYPGSCFLLLHPSFSFSFSFSLSLSLSLSLHHVPTPTPCSHSHSHSHLYPHRPSATARSANAWRTWDCDRKAGRRAPS